MKILFVCCPTPVSAFGEPVVNTIQFGIKMILLDDQTRLEVDSNIDVLLKTVTFHNPSVINLAIIAGAKAYLLANHGIANVYDAAFLIGGITELV